MLKKLQPIFQTYSKLYSTASSPLIITDNCINRIKHLNKTSNKPNRKLRVAIDSGGCSGFTYKIQFSDDSDLEPEEDLLFEKDGATVVVDKISFELLKGSTIDFKEEFAKSAFYVKENPNAKSSCGCKTSFEPKTE